MNKIFNAFSPSHQPIPSLEVHADINNITDTIPAIDSAPIITQPEPITSKEIKHMSFFTDLESVASKIEKEFEKLYGEAPTILAVTSSTLTYLGPLLQTIVTLTAGAPAGSETAKLLAVIKSDLVTATQVVTTVGQSPSLTSLLNGIQSNLGALLAAAKISNPNSVAEIEVAIGLVAKEFAALSSVL